MVLPSSNRVSRAPPYSWTLKIASRTGLSPSLVRLSILFWSQFKKPLAWSAFARHYLRSLVWCLFLRGLRYFSSPGSPLHPMYSGADTTYVAGFPIRISVGHSVLAANHSFSQPVTSFIASWNQGIHQMPFSFLSFSRGFFEFCFLNSENLFPSGTKSTCQSLVSIIQIQNIKLTLVKALFINWEVIINNYNNSLKWVFSPAILQINRCHKDKSLFYLPIKRMLLIIWCVSYSQYYKTIICSENSRKIRDLLTTPVNNHHSSQTLKHYRHKSRRSFSEDGWWR